MPSGGITITPGYQLAPGEKVNNAKLNQLGQPVGRVDEGAIGGRELDEGLATVINALKGKNLFCNGSFQLWNNEAYTGLVGSLSHEYGSAARWVVANTLNRTISRQQFPAGSTDVPNAIDFLRWQQDVPVTPNPSYLGQRLEDVRRFSNLTVTLSVYLRANINLTVIPKLRQVFGGARRIIAGSLSAAGGTNVVLDSAASFRASDVGAAIIITGSGFTTVNSTITGFTNSSQITVGVTIAAGAWSGLTASITGTVGSTNVVTSGLLLSLVANTWTRLEQVFAVPDVTGSTIPGAIDSFTEFRVEVPQGITFQIDFCNAQLEIATAATNFERRLLHEDIAYANFYYEQKLMIMSNAVTIWKPFISLAPKIYRPTLAWTSTGGTGGVLALDFVYIAAPNASNNFVYQTVNHSLIAETLVTADAELRD